MSDRKMTSPGGSEEARRATGEAPGLVAQKSRRQFRMSAGRKEAAVLRLLKGESLEVLSRELRVTAAELSGWREAFLAGGANALKVRETDQRDEEITRLKAKIGDLTMANELLDAKIDKLEGGVPLRLRRSKS
jgi:hypothetical protein